MKPPRCERCNGKGYVVFYDRVPRSEGGEEVECGSCCGSGIAGYDDSDLYESGPDISAGYYDETGGL